MIRVSCERDGTRAIILVLQPENVRRMLAGNPIMLDLRPLAADAISQPLHLLIEAPEDFEARKRELMADAQADQAAIRIIGKPAGGVM